MSEKELLKQAAGYGFKTTRVIEQVEGDEFPAVAISSKGKRILTAWLSERKVESLDVHTTAFATKKRARVGARLRRLTLLYGRNAKAFAEEPGTIVRFPSLPGITFELTPNEKLIGAANLWPKLLATNPRVISISITAPTPPR